MAKATGLIELDEHSAKVWNWRWPKSKMWFICLLSMFSVSVHCLCTLFLFIVCVHCMFAFHCKVCMCACFTLVGHVYSSPTSTATCARDILLHAVRYAFHLRGANVQGNHLWVSFQVICLLQSPLREVHLPVLDNSNWVTFLFQKALSCNCIPVLYIGHLSGVFSRFKYSLLDGLLG